MSPDPRRAMPPVPPLSSSPEAEALDRYWDALTQPRPADDWATEPLLDASLTRTVRRVQFGNDAPMAETAFASRLWVELMAGAGRPIGGATPFVGLPPRRLVLEMLVAAALLMAIVGGGATMGLPGGFDPGATTAVAMAASCDSAPVSTMTAASVAVPVPLPRSLELAATACLTDTAGAAATPR